MSIGTLFFTDDRRTLLVLSAIAALACAFDLIGFVTGVNALSLVMGGFLSALCLTCGLGWSEHFNPLQRVGLFGIAGFIPITTPAILLPADIGSHAALFFVLARVPVFCLVLGTAGPVIMARLGRHP